LVWSGVINLSLGPGAAWSAQQEHLPLYGKALQTKVQFEYIQIDTSSGPDQKGLPARDKKMPRKKSRSRFPEMSEKEKG
jgi:hypothetical protein